MNITAAPNKLSELVSSFQDSLNQRDWQSARGYALVGASLAEALNDFEMMGWFGDHLERFNEFTVAGRLMAKAGRHYSNTCGMEWDGAFVHGTLLIEQRLRHIGAPIRNARHVEAARKLATRCVAIIDDRLHSLYSRTFPGVEVHRASAANDEVRASADAVAGFETLLQHLAPTADAVERNFVPIRPDHKLITEFRDRYRSKSGFPTIGVAWGSTNNSKELPPLSFWAELLRQLPGQFISLQYGDVRENIAQLGQQEANVFHDETVDSLVDLDRFAAQISSLDAVITISNTAAHMAGALGLPTIVILDDKFHLTWPIDAERTPFYPNSLLIRKKARDWSELIPLVHENLALLLERTRLRNGINPTIATLISDNYCSLNSRLHESNARYGSNGKKWADEIRAIAQETTSETILDYGCGKGSLSSALPELNVSEYDPAIPGKNFAPSNADLVVCTDVLEHIEPDFLDNVLLHLTTLANKRVFFTISTRPAVKELEDGRNTHLIIRDQSWWRERLDENWSILRWHHSNEEVVGVAMPKAREMGTCN